MPETSVVAQTNGTTLPQIRCANVSLFEATHHGPPPNLGAFRWRNAVRNLTYVTRSMAFRGSHPKRFRGPSWHCQRTATPFSPARFPQIFRQQVEFLPRPHVCHNTLRSLFREIGRKEDNPSLDTSTLAAPRCAESSTDVGYLVNGDLTRRHADIPLCCDPQVATAMVEQYNTVLCAHSTVERTV